MKVNKSKIGFSMAVLVIFGASTITGILFPHDIASAVATTYTVNSTEDTSDGSCDHPYVNSSSDCTLREAIIASNANSGTDTIVFDIDAAFADDGDGQWTITTSSAMESITDPTIITAASVWDSDDDRPGIRILGSTSYNGFSLTSSSTGSEISGLEIDTHDRGISVYSTDVIIGTDCDGTNDASERNVIHGNENFDIYINASGTKIKGNYLGIETDGKTLDSAATLALNIYGASADDIVIGFEDGTTGSCSAVVQRNVIGLGSGGEAGIQITGTTTNELGDASSAPDNIKIAGNYIGVGADGSADIAGGDYGVNARSSATEIYVGTDGDGTDDDLEQNLISGWNKRAVFIFKTGGNRVSGNVIGFESDKSTALQNGEMGMLIRGDNNIIGWCDASIDATLCSNSGSQSTQANIIGYSGESGISLGAGCDGCLVYGNYIGTDPTGTSDYGNKEHGIVMRRRSDNIKIGGSTSDYQNVIKFNDLGGVFIDGLYRGGSGLLNDPTEGWAVQNNVISKNDGYGIRIYDTELDSSVDPDGTVTGNTIERNSGAGLIIEGSSPSVTSNTIRNNTGYAVEVLPGLRGDEPGDGVNKGQGFDHSCDVLCPAEASSDLISKPTISSNALADNDGGGIYILESEPTNEGTLTSDNTIATNGSFDVRKDWYAAVELIDTDSNPLTSASVKVTLVPNGQTCTGTCTGQSYEATGSSAIFGPEGIDYEDVSTWFKLTEYIIDTAGTITQYNDYDVRVSGVYQGETSFSFDGNSGNDTDTAGLPTSIATASLARYQIAEAIVVLTPPPGASGSVATTTNEEPVCTGPNFSQFSVVDGEEVDTLDKISFMSSQIHASSAKIKVNEKDITVQTERQDNGDYEVSADVSELDLLGEVAILFYAKKSEDCDKEEKLKVKVLGIEEEVADEAQGIEEKSQSEDVDTDGDGFTDQYEISNLGSDPLDACDPGSADDLPEVQAECEVKRAEKEALEEKELSEAEKLLQEKEQRAAQYARDLLSDIAEFDSMEYVESLISYDGVARGIFESARVREVIERVATHPEDSIRKGDGLILSMLIFNDKLIDNNTEIHQYEAAEFDEALINMAYHRMVINKFIHEKFSRREALKRGEAARLLVKSSNAKIKRKFGVRAEESFGFEKNPFGDIDMSSPHAPYILYLKKHGLLQESDEFKPNEGMTNAEFIELTVGVKYAIAETETIETYSTEESIFVRFFKKLGQIFSRLFGWLF